MTYALLNPVNRAIGTTSEGGDQLDWRNDPYWKYETFPRDEPAETFDVFADAVRMWRSKAGPGRVAPDWSDISLDDLEGWWGWTYVYDLHHPSEPVFRIRLWGSKIANVLGYDITGQILHAEDAAEAAHARQITRNDLIFARHILDVGLIGRGSGPLNVDHGHKINYFEVMLPLSSDGSSFDKTLNFCWINHPAFPR